MRSEHALPADRITERAAPLELWGTAIQLAPDVRSLPPKLAVLAAGPGTRPITAASLRGEAWKYYFVCVTWPLYLLTIPSLYHSLGWWSLAAVVFPGAFLFNWLAILLHDSWHRYVPNVNHGVLYPLYAWMLLADPQLFSLLHGHHHSRVSTWDDREVHPFGNIRHRPLAVLNNVLELTTGMMYILLGWHIVVLRHPVYRNKHRWQLLLASAVVWVVFLGGIGWASHLLFGVTAVDIAVSFLLSYWAGSMVLHYSTLIQHGNLIVDGDLDERNRWVRSLRPSGLLTHFFLILTHQDQVLHHLFPNVNWRPFRNNRIAIPPNAVQISFRDLGVIARDMLAGRVTDYERLGRRTPASQPQRAQTAPHHTAGPQTTVQSEPASF